MIVYLASALALAPAAREWAATLRDNGMHVSSRWHDIAADDAVDPTDDSVRANILAENLADLRKAHCVLALMNLGAPRATNAEIGFALALEKPVVWFSGPTSLNDNLFTAHPLVQHTRAPSNALALLVALARSAR